MQKYDVVGQAPSYLPEGNWKLVWSDEFEGTELDRSKWVTEWWVTERKGGYWHEDMVSVKDGNLIIRSEYLEEPLPNYYENSSIKLHFLSVLCTSINVLNQNYLLFVHY